MFPLDSPAQWFASTSRLLKTFAFLLCLKGLAGIHATSLKNVVHLHVTPSRNDSHNPS